VTLEPGFLHVSTFTEHNLTSLLVQQNLLCFDAPSPQVQFGLVLGLGVLKQQKIYLSIVRWLEVQDSGEHDCILVRASFWSLGFCFLFCPHMVGGGGGERERQARDVHTQLSDVLSHKGISPIAGVTSSNPDCILKPHLKYHVFRL
jgi:hypothetical protein